MTPCSPRAIGLRERSACETRVPRRFRGAGEGLRFLDSLYQDASHHVVFVDRDLERVAVDQWLRRYGDQRLSLADAVSFEVMKTRSIRQVLALDEHFALAGFEAVP